MRSIKIVGFIAAPLACIVGLALVAFTLETAEAAADHVTLQLKWVRQAQFAGFYVALEKGFYAAEKLNVDLSPAAIRLMLPGPSAAAVPTLLFWPSRISSSSAARACH